MNESIEKSSTKEKKPPTKVEVQTSPKQRKEGKPNENVLTEGAEANEAIDDLNKTQEVTNVRQDLSVLISSDKDLRSYEILQKKCSQFTGLSVKVKQLNEKQLEVLLVAIEKDAEDFNVYWQNVYALRAPLAKKEDIGPLQLNGMPPAATLIQPSTSGIVNLRFEECQFTSKSIQYFKDWMLRRNLIETLEIVRVQFQSPLEDFKRLMESIQFNSKLRKLTISQFVFDEDVYAKSVSRMLNDSKTIRELDINFCEFIHPKSFYEMCSALFRESSRLNILRIRNQSITALEAKVIQLFLLKNKQMHTLDISNSRVENPDQLEFFFQKLNKDSMIRYLTINGIQADISLPIEVLGEAISENNKIEILKMNENKIKPASYLKFWESIKNNKSLKKITAMKTEINDRICDEIGFFLSRKTCNILELDLSKNIISDLGLTSICQNLMIHSTIQYLNLAQNQIRDKGLVELVQYLVSQKCTLIELSLSGNKINNEGIEILSGFLEQNKTLKMLDISRNEFSDHGFDFFATQIAFNTCLQMLDISRNKELNDEGSLVTFAQSIAMNKSIQTLDMNGIRIRKPYLKSHFEPALISNITLKFVLAKMTPDIIDESLNTNIQIEKQVLPNYQLKFKIKKGDFNIKVVDPHNQSYLNMSDKDTQLFQPSLKFVKYHDIRSVNFSGMKLQDISMQIIAEYLSRNPNLRSLILDRNQITDHGMRMIAKSLKKNKKLAHISFKECDSITQEGLNLLHSIISTENSVLYSIQFSTTKQNEEIGKLVIWESSLNQAIQENLKPEIIKTSLIENQGQAIINSERSQISGKQVNNRFSTVRKEVVFDEKASITKYFDSVVKCWRINNPTVIHIENQGMTDENCLLLCEFLKDKNMINELNLRRNKITNIGAQYIADLITDHDNVITKLDLTRNKITEAGGQFILQALKKVVRIIECQIVYGNHILPITAIETYLELKANENIHKNNTENQIQNPKIKITKIRYELIDKGPDYIRCAIKSVELLKILHMSLPDNMISKEEAEMLARMIRQNPPLMTLNISNNNLDSDCALLLAESLKYNNRIQVLNVSKNKLGDLGIETLLKPFIKQRFDLYQQGQKKHFMIEEASTVIQENSKQHQNTYKNKVKSPRLQQKQPVIDEPKISALKKLDISRNLSTIESYRSIWLLMKVNQHILLQYDSPLYIKERLKRKSTQNEYDLVDFEETSQILVVSDSLNIERIHSDQSNKLLSQQDQIMNKAEDLMELNESHDESEDLEAQTKLEMQKKEQEVKDSQETIEKFKKRKCIKLAAKLCLYSFDDEEDNFDPEERGGLLKIVCCWRLYRSRQAARQFWLDDDEPFSEIEKPEFEKCISTLLLFSHFLMYVVLIIPFVYNQTYSEFIIIGYIAFFSIIEIAVLCSYRKKVDCLNFNFYILITMISGFFNRVMLLAVAYFGGCNLYQNSLSQNQNTNLPLVGEIFSIILLIVSQVMRIIKIFEFLKVKNTSLRPYRERNQKLAHATYFKGLFSVLQKCSIEPSIHSHNLTKEIYENLQYLENAPLPWHKIFQNKFVYNLKTSYSLNHILWTNIPAIFLISEYSVLFNDEIAPVTVHVLIWFFDLILVSVQFLSEEGVVTMNTEKLHIQQKERFDQFAAHYDELTNIDELLKSDQSQITESIHQETTGNINNKPKFSESDLFKENDKQNLSARRDSQGLNDKQVIANRDYQGLNDKLGLNLTIETNNAKQAWPDNRRTSVIPDIQSVAVE